MAEATLRRRRLLHVRWRLFLDGRGCSRTTETSSRTVETIPGWQRLLSDDGDYSTDGGDHPWMAEAALRRRRLLHEQWRPFLDGGSCSQMTETLHGWRRMLSDDGDFSTDDGDHSWMAETVLGRRRLFHGRWKPSMDGGGCSRTTETSPRTVETIHG